MTATHSWNIPQLRRRTLDDTIDIIHWELISEESGNSVRSYGSVKFTGTQDIPWASLIESNAYDYLVTELGGAGIISAKEAIHQSKLDELNAPTTTYGVPW